MVNHDISLEILNVEFFRYVCKRNSILLNINKVKEKTNISNIWLLRNFRRKINRDNIICPIAFPFDNKPARCCNFLDVTLLNNLIKNEYPLSKECKHIVLVITKFSFLLFLEYRASQMPEPYIPCVHFLA
jgi:hypothetical protein